MTWVTSALNTVYSVHTVNDVVTVEVGPGIDGDTGLYGPVVYSIP